MSSRSEILDRTPPQSAESERYVLACALIGGAPVVRRLDLTPDHFYADAHRRIFAGLVDLEGDGRPIEGSALADLLAERDELEEVGGLHYLAKLATDCPPTTANVEYYASKIRDTASKRQLIELTTRGLQAAWNGHTPGEIIAGIGRDLATVSADHSRAVSIGQLAQQHRRLRPPIIDGLLREGETANIIAPPKVGKSWLAYGLALSIATGRHWFGRFACASGKVLLIDNELHAETIAHRIPAVGDALAIPAREYQERIDVIPLRGRLVDVFGLQTIIAAAHGYKAVICDALYRFLPAGQSENDNGGMAQVFNAIDRYAARTQAAWILIHHTSKGLQGDKATTDVGAGAGSQSRAADAHIVLRPHEEPDCVVLDAAVRSFPPVEPLALRWAFPVWQPADGLDASKLKGRLSAQEQKQHSRDDEGMQAILRGLDRPATPRVLRGKTGLSRERQERLLDTLESKGRVSWIPTKVRGQEGRLYSRVDDLGDD